MPNNRSAAADSHKSAFVMDPNCVYIQLKQWRPLATPNANVCNCYQLMNEGGSAARSCPDQDTGLPFSHSGDGPRALPRAAKLSWATRDVLYSVCKLCCDRSTGTRQWGRYKKVRIVAFGQSGATVYNCKWDSYKEMGVPIVDVWRGCHQESGLLPMS